MRSPLAVCCAVVFGLSPLTAQSTSAFDVLTIGAGMSASSRANAAAAELDSIEGAFHNPASLGSLAADLSAAGSYDPYLTMTLVSGIVAVRFKALTFAASAYGVMFDPIIGDIAYDGDVGRVLPAGDYVLGASGACSIDTLLSLPFMLSFGLTLRYAAEVLDTENMSALVGDAGAVIAFRNIAADDDVLSFGVYGKNIGVALSSPIPITLPAAITAGVSYRINPKDFILAFKVLVDGVYCFNDTPKMNVGAAIELFTIASLRFGYMFGYDARGFTAGAGARLPFGDTAITFDYAVVPMGDLGVHHALTIGASFGSTAPAREGMRAQ